MSEHAVDRPEQSSKGYLQTKHDFISSLSRKEIVLNDTYTLIKLAAGESWNVVLVNC